mmetsp:Transcript_51235/g.120243  ORF Transcript_51235/g.120243 Transcript_51235/m.120243 type:complete len:164 (-) Transcript_51235:155-646(-)
MAFPARPDAIPTLSQVLTLFRTDGSYSRTQLKFAAVSQCEAGQGAVARIGVKEMSAPLLVLGLVVSVSLVAAGIYRWRHRPKATAVCDHHVPVEVDCTGKDDMDTLRAELGELRAEMRRELREMRRVLARERGAEDMLPSPWCSPAANGDTGIIRAEQLEYVC